MKKKKSSASSSIYSLGDKASKAKKTDETSTPNASTTPINLQLALVQAPDAEHEAERSRATPATIVMEDAMTDEDEEEIREICRHLSMILAYLDIL